MITHSLKEREYGGQSFGSLQQKISAHSSFIRAYSIISDVLTRWRPASRHDRHDDCCVVGELGLDGAVRPVKGVLSIALETKRRGRLRVLVPEANAPEAAVIWGIQVFPIRCLKDAWDFLLGETMIPPFHLDRRAFFDSHRFYDVDFDEVRGQHHVKRALEVAASGGHNLLMVGG